MIFGRLNNDSGCSNRHSLMVRTPLPCPEEAAQAYTPRELEDSGFPPLCLNLLEWPFARTALDQEGTSSVLSYSGNIDASSLPCPPVFVLEQPVSPLLLSVELRSFIRLSTGRCAPVIYVD